MKGSFNIFHNKLDSYVSRIKNEIKIGSYKRDLQQHQTSEQLWEENIDHLPIVSKIQHKIIVKYKLQKVGNQQP